MSIDPINPAGNTPPLRLINPATEPAAVQPVKPAQPTEPRSRASRSDSLHFDSVYVSRLPRVPANTPAQQRLERLRNELVAARVDQPIHFDHTPNIASKPLNAYARFTPAPADVNDSATERAVED